MSGVISPRLEDDGWVTVDMGAPVFDPQRVPFDTHGLQARSTASLSLWPLVIHDRPIEIAVLSMGNPHAVQWVVDVDAAPVSEDGPVIEHHPRFARRVNAGFMQIVDRHTIKLRVFERGAGETLACGTGACAAVVAGILRGDLDSPVSVETRGGRLSIAWQGDDTPVLLTGPAVSVFEGSVDI
jgi:diaminopimelate epimerase